MNYSATVTLSELSLDMGAKRYAPPNTINSRYTPSHYDEAKHHYFSVISRMNYLSRELRMLDDIKLMSSTGSFHAV